MLKSRKDMATRASDHSHSTILTQLRGWVHVINVPPDLAVMPLSTLCCGVLLNSDVFLPPFTPVRRQRKRGHLLLAQFRKTHTLVQTAHFSIGSAVLLEALWNGIATVLWCCRRRKRGINMHPKCARLLPGSRCCSFRMDVIESAGPFPILIFHHKVIAPPPGEITLFIRRYHRYAGVT